MPDFSPAASPDADEPQGTHSVLPVGRSATQGRDERTVKVIPLPGSLPPHLPTGKSSKQTAFGPMSLKVWLRINSEMSKVKSSRQGLSWDSARFAAR